MNRPTPKMVKCTPLLISGQMSVSPWMTLMTVFIVQFSILRSSRSLTSVYLDDDNWLIIRSETGIKVWGKEEPTQRVGERERGRGLNIITDQVGDAACNNWLYWGIQNYGHYGKECTQRLFGVHSSQSDGPANIIRLWHDPLYKPFVINEFYIRKLLSRGGAR